SGTINATASLSVSSATLLSISIAPPAPVLANGTAVQMSATGLYTDGSSQDLTVDITWSTDDASIAFSDTVPGLLLAQGVGSGTVTAALGGVSAITPARVTDATLTSLSISPAAPTFPVGTSISLTARGFYSDGSSQDLSSLVSWASADEATIAVSNTSG